jgi:ABC-type multidrug transport system fused ATPase/permease subunit
VRVTAARIQTRDLAVARGGRVLLQGVDLRLEAGEVVALTGPSGAGKSTLLRCLVRLDEPHAGHVLLDGRDVRELDPCLVRRRIGLVAQAPVMLPGDVRANVAYGLDGIDDAAVLAALESTGLDGSFLEREARRLSGGEAARVAVARALARDPAALLLDEPTAALDPLAAAAVERLIAGLASGGRAVLVVTHDRAQAARIAGLALAVEGRRLAPAQALA